MANDQNWRMPLKNFIYLHDLRWRHNAYNPKNQREHYNFAKCFCKQSNEQMQEAIQNATLLQFDAMLTCFELVNAEKNAEIDSQKLKFCLSLCYAIAKKHLVVNHNSRPEDLLLRQELEKHGFQKELLEVQAKKLKMQAQQSESQAQQLESQEQQLESQEQSLLVKNLLLRYAEYVEAYKNICYGTITKPKKVLQQHIQELRDGLGLSFIDFLILINHDAALENIFKYIDFLEPEYFERDKLIDFIDFSLQCIDKPKLLPLGLNSEEIQEKVDNFINKITVEHILLIKYGDHKANKSDDAAKEFIEKTYTFKQLAVFWSNLNDACLDNNNASLQFANISSVLFMFLEDLLNRIENVGNIDSIMNLLDTNPSIATTLLTKVNKNVLLELHRYIFYAPEKEKPHCYEESAKKKFNEIVVGHLEANFAPEHILELIYDSNYDDFAFHLSYKTIVKILHIVNNPSKYIDKIHNIEHILSDDNKHKLVLAFDRRFQNDTQCDKSPEFKDLIECDVQEYKNEYEAYCLKMLQCEANVMCDSMKDKEKRGSATVFLDDASSKLDTLVLMNTEDKEYKSNKIQPEVDSIEALQGVDSIEIPQGEKGVVCNSGEVKENRKPTSAPLSDCVVSKFSKPDLAHNL